MENHNKSLIKPLLAALALTSLSACQQKSSAPEAVTPVAEKVAASTASTDERPNFLLIVADDLGYADLGAFGGEIGTPNLDALAENGLQLTNFHTAPTCSPTRSMLLTGTDNHMAGMGAMNEAKRMLRIPPDISASDAYAGHLNRRVATLPEVLGAAGYRTYMAGKWHLGEKDDQTPHARGFQQTFSMLEGGAGHLSNRKVIPFGDRDHALYRANGKPTDVPEGFYSTAFYADQIIKYLDDDKDSEKPFFAYLAFTAPHWPLQAPAESIARFKGKYDAGYEALFKERLARQKAMGLAPEGELGQPLIHAKPWAELTADEQKEQARAMEIYAAMVSDMDTYIGKVVDALKASGEYDNTVIFFMSDNGAEFGHLDEMSWMGDYLDHCCDLSFDNMGAADSFVSYDSGWARAGNVPTKFFKSYTTQGGLLAPAIVLDPRQTDGKGRYTNFLSVKDVMPTFLDLAGVAHPAPEFDGRAVVPMQGESIAPALKDPQQAVHPDDYVMGWELHFNRALRKGDWKITLSQPLLGDRQWGLYNLADDPSETHDLSEVEPEKFAELLAHWEAYAEENEVYSRPQ